MRLTARSRVDAEAEDAAEEHVEADALAKEDRKDQDEGMRSLFAVAHHAWTHSLKVLSSDPSILHGLATTAEHRGEFDLARERLTQLIVQIEEGKRDDDGSVLFALRLQRARVTTRLGDEVAKGNAERPGDLARGLALVNEGIRDLELCSQVTDVIHLHHYLPGRLETLLTRGELQCKLGSVQLAQVDCRDARAALNAWIQLARKFGEHVPKSTTRKYETRLQNLQRCIGVGQAASDPSAN